MRTIILNQCEINEGDYILPPLVYNSENKAKIEKPLIEETVNRQKKIRLTLRAYFSNRFLGSPVLKKFDDTPKGVKVFIPKVNEDWTAVQIAKIYERAIYGIPVVLEKGLIISYFEFCRELHTRSLTFNNKEKTIKPSKLILPKFEDWLGTKEGYRSIIEREKSESIVKENEKLTLEVDELKDSLTEFKIKEIIVNRIKLKYDALMQSAKKLELQDDSFIDDLVSIEEDLNRL